MVSNSSGNRLPPVAPPYGAITQSTQGKGQVNQDNPQPNRTAASSSGPRCCRWWWVASIGGLYKLGLLLHFRPSTWIPSWL